MSKVNGDELDDVEGIVVENLINFSGSVLGFAKWLAVNVGLKSVKGWEMYLWRFKTRAPHYFEAAMGEGKTYDEGKGYYYNQSNDTYVTFLRSAGKDIVVQGSTHRAMRQAYSNMIGKGSSINEIGREFNFPRNWFNEYRRRHGWTHDMDPYTDEEILDNDTEELVEDLALRRRRLLHRANEKKKWDDIQDAADKWENFQAVFLEEILRHLKQEEPSPPPKVVIGEGEHPYALVMSPTDFHWGKYGWEDEVGETYDFEEARSRIIDSTNGILSRLSYNPEKIIVATGSDWFHIDNDLGNTTRGTVQDMAGSPAQILITGCEMAREHINMLRQIAPVEVVFMPGNHDRHSSLALMLYLSAVYENCEDVSVEMNPQTRRYVTYGDTLLGFTHGDSVKRERLPALMAVEKPFEWGNSECRIWFTGHKHHQNLLEQDGAYLIQLPSLAGEDRWHYRKGYVTAKAGLSAHIIEKEGGLAGSIFRPVTRHDA